MVKTPSAAADDEPVYEHRAAGQTELGTELGGLRGNYKNTAVGTEFVHSQ